jgi:LacI family transcriptional regulator
VSFDASDLSTWLRPRVTSVELSFAELGARAIDLLLADTPAGTVVRLPMPVRYGESVG